MDTVVQLRKHPIAIVIYTAYLFLWVFFVVGSLRISARQEMLGEVRCMTGSVVVFFFLMFLSAIYLTSTLFFAAFNTSKKFFMHLALAILLPPGLILLLLYLG